MRNETKFTIIGRVGQITTPPSGGLVRYVSIASGYDVRDESTSTWERRTRWNHVKILNPHLIERADKRIEAGVDIIVKGLPRVNSYTPPNAAKPTYETELVVTDFDIFDRTEASDRDASHDEERPASAPPDAEPSEQAAA